MGVYMYIYKSPHTQKKKKEAIMECGDTQSNDNAA